ncbi:MAG TPA: hypothetical protein VJQ56_06080 [Blastocatellia bacterium]|nr:hypothetical protein [Blastocatellia bacterium]
MKRVLSVLFLGLLITAQATAQPPASPAGQTADKPATAQNAPTTDQILDKYVQAVGGKAAIEKATSRVAKGTIEIPAAGLKGPIEIYSKAPDKSLFMLTIPGYGVTQVGYDGKTGWSQDPSTGMRDLSGDELATLKRDADFYGTLKIKETFKAKYLGKEKVSGRDTHVLELTPATGSPEKRYFDTETGLLSRIDVETDSPIGKIAVQVYLEDYREVDGVKMPFTVRRTSSAGDFTMKYDEVKNNVPIDDAKFAKPAGQ